MAASALLALPAGASAGGDAEGNCAGLDCAAASVPEAHGGVPSRTGLEGLRAETESGFYDVPALVYQGDIVPRAVVYLSTPGQFQRMPASVRQLPVVRSLELNSAPELKSSSIVVAGPGIVHVIKDEVAAARRAKKKARAAHGAPWSGCQDRNFCLYTNENWGGSRTDLYGPTYFGTGWWNFGGSENNNFESMVNHRDNGDSLLADGAGGAGARYCAHEHTDDGTFSNNFGNNVASSFALLGSDVNRC